MKSSTIANIVFALFLFMFLLSFFMSIKTPDKPGWGVAMIVFLLLSFATYGAVLAFKKRETFGLASIISEKPAIELTSTPSEALSPSSTEENVS